MEKFLADESVDFRVTRHLREVGYEVLAVSELFPGSKDEQLLHHAFSLNLIPITEDHDFGELVIRRKLRHRGIVLLRLNAIPIQQKLGWIVRCFKENEQYFHGSFSVISSTKLRIRRFN